MEPRIYKRTELQAEDPYDLFLYQFLRSENFNMQAICRICLSINAKEMYPLLSSKNACMLADMYTGLTSIQIDNEDRLPIQVCSACQILITQYHDFKMKCEKSYNTLKSILKREREETKRETTVVVIKEELDVDESVECVYSTETETSKKHDEIATNEQGSSQSQAKTEKPLIEEQGMYFVEICVKEEETDNLAQPTSSTDPKSVTDEKIHDEKKKRKKQNNCYECPSCTKTFLKLYLLKAHIKEEHHTKSKLYSCAHKCKAYFYSKNDLNLHNLSLHTEATIWQCPECTREFKNKRGLRRHIKLHMKTKKFSCEVCSKSFIEPSLLRQHVRVHTETKVKKVRNHVCHVCDKKFAWPSDLVIHLRRHNGEKPFTCDQCGKTFVSKHVLTLHILGHSNIKPHTCTYCGKRFINRSIMNIHIRVHTGNRPHVCTTCGKSFIQLSDLKKHIRTHTGERPYPCNVCGKRFTRKEHLKTHEANHTEERPYTCDVCGKGLSRENLEAHMSQHSHECSVCQKKFIKAFSLQEHFRIHTGEKPFECGTCSIRFHRKANYLAHMKTHKEKQSAKEDIG